MISMITRVLITTYLILIPPKTLKCTYLVYAIVQAAGYWIVALGHYLPSISTFLFYLGMGLFGTGRGIYSFPYLILVRTFNQPSDAYAVLIWLALSQGGNTWGIFF